MDLGAGRMPRNMILLGAALILSAGVVLFALTAEPGSNRKAGTSGNEIRKLREASRALP